MVGTSSEYRAARPRVMEAGVCEAESSSQGPRLKFVQSAAGSPLTLVPIAARPAHQPDTSFRQPREERRAVMGSRVLNFRLLFLILSLEVISLSETSNWFSIKNVDTENIT